MEHLKCNELRCRAVLRETAVVTTCSHVFCTSCANELFRNAQICPACSASLTEPDDIVVASLQPTNDYKTSILSGLSPGIILQICERAISFWEYQSRQESAYQQAILKSINDKCAQYYKQWESAVREANSELGLLNDKVKGLERELELERRKTREHQEQLRERDKEYSKLKSQYDQLKRKALLAPSHLSAAANHPNLIHEIPNTIQEQLDPSLVNVAGLAGFGSQNVSNVVNGMEAAGMQRTPLRSSSNISCQPKLAGFGSANRNKSAAQTTTRFRLPDMNSQTGIRQQRSDVGEENMSDSANEGAGTNRKHTYRGHCNHENASSRLQYTSGARPAQRIEFGQTSSRVRPSPTGVEVRQPGTFRPAGFSR